MKIDQINKVKEYFKSKDYVSAAAFLAKLGGEYRDDPNFLYFSAYIARKTGNLDQAESFCKKALEIYPKSREMKFELGLIYQTTGNYKEAIGLLEEAASNEDGDVYYIDQLDIMNSLALTYKKSGDFKNALNRYGLAFNFLIKMANEYAHKQGGATEEAKKFLKRDNLACTISNNMGTILAELEDFETAKKMFNQAIEFTPDGLNYPDPKIGLESLNKIIN